MLVETKNWENKPVVFNPSSVISISEATPADQDRGIQSIIKLSNNITIKSLDTMEQLQEKINGNTLLG